MVRKQHDPAALAIVTWLAALILFMPAISFASGYNFNIGLPVTTANGGTGTTYGGGLIGPTVATLTGTTILTADSAGFEILDTTAGAFSVTLPLASTCAGKTITLYHNATASAAVTITRQGSDTLGHSTITSYSITSANAYLITYISDGVSNWVPLQPMFQINTTSSSQPLGYSSTAFAGLARPTSSFTGLTGVGALTVGSIASGFGTIATANTISTSSNISTTSSGTITSATTLTATSGNITATNGDLVSSTLGKTLKLQEGAGGMLGVAAAMSSGTVTVTNANVLTGDRIFLSRVSGTAGNAGFPSYTISNATSFTINSTNGADDSVYAYAILRDAP